MAFSNEVELFGGTFRESSEVSGSPEKGADFWKGPRDLFGELQGKSGKLLGNLWIVLKNPLSEKFQGSRRGTSGEVGGNSGRGSLGNFWGTSGLVLKIHWERSSREVEELPQKWVEILGSPGVSRSSERQAKIVSKISWWHLAPSSFRACS